MSSILLSLPPTAGPGILTITLAGVTRQEVQKVLKIVLGGWGEEARLGRAEMEVVRMLGLPFKVEEEERMEIKKAVTDATKWEETNEPKNSYYSLGDNGTSKVGEILEDYLVSNLEEICENPIKDIAVSTVTEFTKTEKVEEDAEELLRLINPETASRRSKRHISTLSEPLKNISKSTAIISHCNHSHAGLKKIACRKCPNCKKEDCMNCKFCKDKVQYGGPGKLRKSCEVKDKCVHPLVLCPRCDRHVPLS